MSIQNPELEVFFRWKTNEAFRVFHAENETLYSHLRRAYDNLHGNPAVISAINKIKAKMLLLQSKFSKLFERLNDRVLGDEKLSTFQLGDRFKRKNNSYIKSIDIQGANISDPPEIEKHNFDYFENMYSKENLRDRSTYHCNRTIPVDSECNNQAMAEITTAEIFLAIKTSASNKSR